MSESTKIEQLLAAKKIKEDELKQLEKDIAKAQLEDIESRFHLEKQKWYKVRENQVNTIYFRYSEGTFIRDGYLQSPFYITESLGKAFHKIELGYPLFLKLEKDPAICLNAGYGDFDFEKSFLSPFPNLTSQEVKFEEVSDGELERVCSNIERMIPKRGKE